MVEQHPLELRTPDLRTLEQQGDRAASSALAPPDQTTEAVAARGDPVSDDIPGQNEATDVAQVAEPDASGRDAESVPDAGGEQEPAAQDEPEAAHATGDAGADKKEGQADKRTDIALDAGAVVAADEVEVKDLSPTPEQQGNDRAATDKQGPDTAQDVIVARPEDVITPEGDTEAMIHNGPGEHGDHGQPVQADGGAAVRATEVPADNAEASAGGPTDHDGGENGGDGGGDDHDGGENGDASEGGESDDRSRETPKERAERVAKELGVDTLPEGNLLGHVTEAYGEEFTAGLVPEGVELATVPVDEENSPVLIAAARLRDTETVDDMSRRLYALEEELGDVVLGARLALGELQANFFDNVLNAVDKQGQSTDDGNDRLVGAWFTPDAQNLMLTQHTFGEVSVQAFDKVASELDPDYDVQYRLTHGKVREESTEEPGLAKVTADDDEDVAMTGRGFPIIIATSAKRGITRLPSRFVNGDMTVVAAVFNSDIYS
jgi:hypothetical protein